MICHIVLFSPKPSLSDAHKRSLAKLVVDSVTSIGSVARATVGRRTLIDAGYPRLFGEKTYEFAAVLEFEDKSGLLDYLNHPLHHELGELFWESCEQTLISEIEAIDLTAPNAIDMLVS